MPAFLTSVVGLLISTSHNTTFTISDQCDADWEKQFVFHEVTFCLLFISFSWPTHHDLVLNHHQARWATAPSFIWAGFNSICLTYSQRLFYHNFRSAEQFVSRNFNTDWTQIFQHYLAYNPYIFADCQQHNQRYRATTDWTITITQLQLAYNNNLTF